MKKWIKKDKLASVEEVFLRNIGQSSLDDINNWFTKSYKNGYKIEFLREAAEFALSFKDKKILIAGDFDVDGVCASAILYLGLQKTGIKNIRISIPKRETEGFGISLKTVKRAVDEKVGLIITCDNGIAQVEAINYAKHNGISVIILDHHEANGDLPNADYIFDPVVIKGQCDFAGYCGAGLCYKFIKELLSVAGIEDKNFIGKLLAYCAIATVADVMVLREENYVFVKNGLKRLNNPSLITKGLYALVSQLNICHENITAKEIGFKIAPVLNAQSRMSDDGAYDALKLLLIDDDYNYAKNYAEKLCQVNDKRKELQKFFKEGAEEYIRTNCLYGNVPTIIVLDDCPAGLVGIISGNITEKYKVPSIVLCKSNGLLKGSGRSCGNYDLKAQLDKCSHLLEKYGGHKEAAGLSLKITNLYELTDTLLANSEDFVSEDVNEIKYDLEISVKDVPKTIELLNKFEPFGNGNPMPVFKISDFLVTPKAGKYITPVANGMKAYSNSVCAIGFDIPTSITSLENPQKFEIVGTLSNNYFNNDVTPQIEIIDIVHKEVERKKTDLADRLHKLCLIH